MFDFWCTVEISIVDDRTLELTHPINSDTLFMLIIIDYMGEFHIDRRSSRVHLHLVDWRQINRLVG